MPDFSSVKSRFFVDSGDANLPSEPVPSTFENCKITPILDCPAYNQELELALATVGTGATPDDNKDHFILIANWWLGLSAGQYTPGSKTPSFHGSQVVTTDPYYLDGPGATKNLLTILKQKAQAGVDVRVLGWVAFALMESAIAQKSGAAWIAEINAITMKSIQDLRDEATIGSKAALNVISHTAGAVHIKMVVIGNGTEVVGFTGGLDFMHDRWSYPGHYGTEIWHDVTAKVEGPAVQAMYDLFRDMWEENRSRKARQFRFGAKKMSSMLSGAPTLQERTLPTTPRGKHHVQSVRTLPMFNYKWYNCLPENKKLSFGSDGRFEIKTAWKKAILAAQTYIYMEDQTYWSPEIMGWVREAVVNNSGLRVILLASGGADPNDPEFPAGILCASLNGSLLKDLTDTQKGQIRMYRRMGDSRDICPLSITNVTSTTSGKSDLTVTVDPAVTDYLAWLANLWRGGQRCLVTQGTSDFIIDNMRVTDSGDIIFTVQTPAAAPVTGAAMGRNQMGVLVHSKTTLIDDKWAIIGSANIAQRCLYSDIEHAVTFIDEDGLLVKEYRNILWAEHFRHSTPGNFDNIQASLYAWESSWGTAGSAPSRPTYIEPTALPITPESTLTDKEQAHHDQYTDVDSRKAWGGLWP